MIDLDSLIESSRNLAALPESSTRLASLFGREDWEFEEVTSILKLDAPLTGRVLGFANSAASGAKSEIMDVEQAFVRLGPGGILRLALGAAAKKQFECSDAAFGLEEGSLWRHSVASALAVEQARKVLKCVVPPEAFAAALLHDIGLVVLGRFIDREDVRYLRECIEHEAVSTADAELELLQVHHGEVGGLIAASWHLPESIVEAITHHHNPDASTKSEWVQVADLVHLADAVSFKIGCRDSSEGGIVNETVALRLKLTDEKFDELCVEVEERFEEVLASYEV
jgi:putative nucleotidyltransferase with HDIG domain